jgi:hypothetical protein
MMEDDERREEVMNSKALRAVTGGLDGRNAESTGIGGGGGRILEKGHTETETTVAEPYSLII